MALLKDFKLILSSGYHW